MFRNVFFFRVLFFFFFFLFFFFFFFFWGGVSLGSVLLVSVSTADGTRVPSRLKKSLVWPRRVVPAGEPLTVTVTVRRPGWAGWLVGHTETKRFTVDTPVATSAAAGSRCAAGGPVTVAFDRPVHVVWLGPGKPLKRLEYARSVVPVGVTAAAGTRSARSRSRRPRARGRSCRSRSA